MNWNKIANDSESAHQNAVPSGTVKINDLTYSLFFDGRNYVCKQGNKELADFNTRSIAQAKKWLKEYLNN